jgi:hypothetical protein
MGPGSLWLKLCRPYGTCSCPNPSRHFRAGLSHYAPAGVESWASSHNCWYNEVLGIPNEYHRFCGYFLPNSQALAYFHDT